MGCVLAPATVGTKQMSPDVVARPARLRRLAACLCAIIACGLGSALAAVPAQALIEDSSGHRFGIIPRDLTSPVPAVLGSGAQPLAHALALFATAATSNEKQDVPATSSTSSQESATTTADTATSTDTTTTSPSTSTTDTNSTTTTSTTTSPATTTLIYHGGPVLRAHAVYAIYWDPGAALPASFETGVDQFFQDVASASGSDSNEYSVLTQYGDSSGAGVYSSTFGGSFVDNTTAYPANAGSGGCAAPGALPSGYATCLSDAQIQSYLSTVIQANNWPASSAATYFVFLPAGVDECYAATKCADNWFCSYHSSFGTGQPPLYAVMPWADVPGCQTGESPNGSGGDDVLDDQLSLISHEHAEMITDPYETGWWDPTLGYEVGDGCTTPDQFGVLSGLAPDQYNETIGGHDYILQENFSNDGGTCRARFVARFKSPVRVVAGRQTSFSASTSSDPGIATYSWDFGDGTPVTSPAATPTVPHTYADPGTYAVTLTTQDADGNIDSVTHTVAVSTVTARFSSVPAQAAAGQVIAFDASASSSSNGPIVSYQWTFGDGTVTYPAPSQKVHYAYASPNTYQVTLTVTDEAGDTNSVTETLTVGNPTPPNPVASHGPGLGGGSTSTTQGQPSSSGSNPASDAGALAAPGSSTHPDTAATHSPAPAPLLRARIARVAPTSVELERKQTLVQTGEVLDCPEGVVHCVVGVTLIHVTTRSAWAHLSTSVALAAERLVIRPGRSTHITLALNPAAVELLRRAGHLRADLEIVASVAGGAGTTRVLPITLTAPPPAGLPG